MSVKPCKFFDIRSGSPVLIGDYNAALEFLVKNPDVMEAKPATKEALKESIAANVAKLNIQLGDLFKSDNRLGLAKMPEQAARELYEQHKALVETLKKIISDVSQIAKLSAEEFADLLGQKATNLFKSAYNAFKTGKTSYNDFLEFNEIEVEGVERSEEDGAKQVEKKVLGRVFRGTDKSEIKDAIKNEGLYRTPENMDKALQTARDVVEDMGEEAALELARNGEGINGLVRTGIYGVLVEKAYQRTKEAKDADEYLRLTNEAVKLEAETALYGVDAGQRAVMFQKVYESTDVPYDYEAKLSEFESMYGKATEEVKKALKDAQAELDEVNKKLFEANKKFREDQDKEVVEGIKESIERDKKKSVPRSILKELAAKTRKLTTSRPSVFNSATPASLVWDGAVEAVALALYGGAQVEIAIKKGLAHIKNSDWFKGLSDSTKREAEDAFSKEMTAIKVGSAEVVDGEVKIPHSLIRYYVEQGMTDIDEIAKTIQKDLGDEITVRQVRDAITNYGKKANPTKNEVKDKINELKRIGKKISLLEDLKKGIKKEKNPVTKKEMQEKEQRLQREIDALTKDNPEEKIQAQIDELNRRIREKDFSSKTRTAQVEFTEKALKLYAEREAAKEKFDYEFEKARLENRTKSEKRWDFFWDAVGLFKGLKSFLDMSAPLRQGLVGLLSQSPAKSAQQFKFMFKSTWDAIRNKPKVESAYYQWLAGLKNSEYWPLIKESKLFIAEQDPKQIAREEAFATNLTGEAPILEKPLVIKGRTIIPGLRLATASETAYNSFLNFQRVQAFLEGAQMLKEEGKSFQAYPEEYKAYADFINNMAGRANLGKFEQAAINLNRIWFSPRLMAARFNILSPLKYTSMPPAARQMALRRTLMFVGNVAILAGLMSAYFNDDDEEDEVKIELDPRSTDFLKLKLKGDRKLDWAGGFGGYIAMLTQVFYGERKSRTGEIVDLNSAKFGSGNRLDVGVNFLVNKSAPAPNVGLQYLLSVEDLDGIRTNRFGEELTPLKTVQDLIIPLYISDLKKILKGDDPSTSIMLAGLSFFGAGVGMPGEKTKTQSQQIEAKLNPNKDVKKAFNEALESGNIEKAKKAFNKITEKMPEGRVQGELADKFTEITNQNPIQNHSDEVASVVYGLMDDATIIQGDTVTTVRKLYSESELAFFKKKMDDFSKKQAKKVEVLDSIRGGSFFTEYFMPYNKKFGGKLTETPVVKKEPSLTERTMKNLKMLFK